MLKIKQISFLPLVLFTIALFFSACSNDDETIYGPGMVVIPQPEGILDAEALNGFKLYCKDLSGSVTYSSYGEAKHPAPGLDDVKFMLRSSSDLSKIYIDGNLPTLEAMIDYICPRFEFLFDKWVNLNNISLPCPRFYSAYTTGDFSITCDKTLFGLEPGTNLAQFFDFKLNAACLPVGRENPHLAVDLTAESYSDSFGYKASDCFTKDAWLATGYDFVFNTIPEEKYREITLTVTLPVDCQYIYRHFKDNPKGNVPFDFEERTFVSSCTLKFNN